MSYVDPNIAGRSAVPQFWPFRTAAVVAAGAIQTETRTNGPRPFVVTHLKFQTRLVGLPLYRPDFLIAVRDVGAQQEFQLAPYHSNQLGDQTQPPYKLPKPWVITRNNSVDVQFNNIDVLPVIPELDLIGFLSTPEEVQRLREAGEI
jgi:hypothetical protein